MYAYLKSGKFNGVIRIGIIILIVMTGRLYSQGSSSSEGPIIIQLSENITAEILPRIELLSGVLSQTSWMERRGPQGIGNAYFQELQAFFEPHRDHRAIRLAENLTRQGFSFDAPPTLMLHLSPLPELVLVHGYSEYLIQRAGGENRLEEFRLALHDISEQTAFLDFFQEQRPYLELCLQQAVQDFDATLITTWMNEFYGWSGDEFHLVFAPAMFPEGGYGPSIETDGDELIVYQIVRATRSGGDYPIFHQDSSLWALTLHELSHSFVNPSVDKYIHLLEDLNLQALHAPVQELMEELQAYGNLDTFFKETLVRAVTIMALADLFENELEEEQYQALIRYEEYHGFYLTRFSIERLEYYRAHRDQYPRFDDFMPELLQLYSSYRWHLLASLRTMVMYPQEFE